MHLFEYAYVAIALIKVLTGVNMLAVNNKLLVFTFTAASDPSIEHLKRTKKGNSCNLHPLCARVTNRATCYSNCEAAACAACWNHTGKH